MQIQLVTAGSRRWIEEDGVPVWGLGVQVQEIAEASWPERGEPDIHRFGWQIEFTVGPWVLVVWTGDAYTGWHGRAHHPVPFFERIYP